jgi:glycosyltransferase involved in cell wall biosynthesis
MDIVVHASYREGLARVLPQALLAAKPVVAYDLDGAREVVRPGLTGYLVNPGSAAGLAEAVVALGKSPEQRRQYGETGRAKFTDQFRHETMTVKIRQLYNDILGGPPLGGPPSAT